MMDLLLATSGGESQSASGGYVDDVFSAYTYTGNGATQTINNGIDLAGKGGLVWCKSRGSSNTNHFLFDTVRGATKYLASEQTTSEVTNTNTLTAFGSNGFSLGGAGNINGNTDTLISWTFRKAPKFFDIVTYTGNGVAGRQIAHSLGVQAGFVTIKATSTTGDWNSYHRSATGDLKLNLTDAQTASREIITAADASTFTVSGAANTNGVSYVAYLWAHDPSAEGIVQCGSYTGNGSATGPTVTLGWEPQYVLVKSSTLGTASSQWSILDSMRGSLALSSQGNDLFAQSSAAENTSGAPVLVANATGFNLVSPNDRVNASGQTYIYLAIRRPNKPPTSGAQVYSSSTASGVVSAGFPVDLHIGATRTGAASNHAMHARLTGGTRELVTSSAAAEATITDLGFDSMVGLKASLPSGMVNHFFRRAPGVFDVVCYTGDGAYPRTLSHGLLSIPELIIVKRRDSAGFNWPVYFGSINTYLSLNLTTGSTTNNGCWGASAPTASQFQVGSLNEVNGASGKYVAYLFATLAGISKVGSYTGNGTSQTINCGFATGARFILIKRTDATGDWYVWDSVRGIIAANDPHLSLNTTAAEVTTDDSVDPEASGFIVNQNTATNINVNGGQYIFLAIA